MFAETKTIEHEGAAFDIRSMSGREELELTTGLTAGDGIPPARLDSLLRACIIDWRGAVTGTGKPLGEFHPEKVEWLPALAIDYIAAQIMVLSQPTPEEKKTLAALQQ